MPIINMDIRRLRFAYPITRPEALQRLTVLSLTTTSRTTLTVHRLDDANNRQRYERRTNPPWHEHGRHPGESLPLTR